MSGVSSHKPVLSSGQEHPEPAVPTARHARPLVPPAGLTSLLALWLEPFLRGEGHSLVGEGGWASESGLVLPLLSWGAGVSLYEPVSSPVNGGNVTYCSGVRGDGSVQCLGRGAHAS